MAFVQKSIITMALGLDSMQRAICPPNKPGLCPEMLPVNGSILLQHLMNVSFSFLNEEVYFDEQGDPPGKYEILNFQRRRPMHRFNHFNHQVGDSADNDSEAVLEDDDDGDASEENDNLPNNTPPSNTDTTSQESSRAHQQQLQPVQADNGAALLSKKRLNPMYDSYSTLKVYRPSTTSTSTSKIGTGEYSPSSPDQAVPLSSRRRRRRNSRRSGRHIMSERVGGNAGEHHLPASGYSSTNGYEYAHVGSWKSSDGLSLFGQIHWPSWSSAEGGTFTHGSNDGGVSSSSIADPSQQQNHAYTQPKSVCSLPCARGHAKVNSKFQRAYHSFTFVAFFPSPRQRLLCRAPGNRQQLHLQHVELFCKLELSECSKPSTN